MVLVSKKSAKLAENSKINIYSLVPKIDHNVALCFAQSPSMKLNKFRLVLGNDGKWARL